jgi:hypothetical protein
MQTNPLKHSSAERVLKGKRLHDGQAPVRSIFVRGGQRIIVLADHSVTTISKEALKNRFLYPMIERDKNQTHPHPTTEYTSNELTRDKPK